MVMMSSLEKVPAVSNLSSVARDPKLLGIVPEGGISGVHKTLSRSVNQHQKVLSDMYLDAAYQKMDRPMVGVMASQNESSLFSSSLSELVNHKLRISSNKFLSRQGEADPFKSQGEADGQTINNLLPDDEELFSGMVDEMGLVNRANGTDDLEDFDVFTCGGGIELESDDRSQAGLRNVNYSRGLNPSQLSMPAADHGLGVRSIPRLPNREDSHIFDGFRGPVRFSSGGSEFGGSDRLLSFHPRSPQVQLRNVGNIIQQNSLDSMTGIADRIGLRVPNKPDLDVHRLGLNGHLMDLNEGVFGYSPNGIHLHQSMASKSNSYQQHHLRSLLASNSPSFPSSQAPHHGTLTSSPVAHMMMNVVSPIQQLQVGSAPALKASLWDRQQAYMGDSHDASGYQMGAIRSPGIPGFSPSYPREISSHGSLPRAHGAYSDISKGSGIHSPQRMSNMFHERNVMSSLPTSFGSPSERVRTRRNDANSSHADRKHYELNIDRILRGEDTRTTLMIKNIPNKYTSKMLLATIDEQHQGKYDFIYLPIDFKNKCNMGYAFINMIDPLHIVGFHKTFEGRKWEKFNSEKVATLAYARIQGKAALIAHFQNSSLMNEDKRCRPILFHTDGPNAGDQEPFPMGAGFRPKPGRLQVSVRDDDE